MHIAVLLRLMPNPGDELEVDDDGTDIDREYIDMVLNEYDDQALEEAILIKESSGATVTAIGLSGDGIDQALQTAAARGADRTVLIDCEEIGPYDARNAAAAFAAALRELSPDLVLTGVQTPSDVFGQLTPFLAAELGWPHADVVVGVSAQDGHANVLQEYAGGRLARLRLGLPAVVGVQSSTSPPRYVSMARLRQAMSEGAIENLDVSFERTPGPAITSLARPEVCGHATMLEGDTGAVAQQILDLMKEKGALSS